MRPPQLPPRDDAPKDPQRRIQELPVPLSDEAEPDLSTPALTLEPLNIPDPDPARLSSIEQAVERTAEKLAQPTPEEVPEVAPEAVTEIEPEELDLIPLDDLAELEELASLEELAASSAPTPKPGQLSTMLEVFMNTGRWQEATSTLEQLASLEQDPAKKAGYLFSAGVVMRDELARPELALAHFEAALDVDPRQLKAFAAIDKILTKRKNWTVLERAYRKMIFRLPEDDSQQLSLRVQLWNNLGEIYRTRIGDFDKALIAFESAHRLDPSNTQLPVIIQELKGGPPKAPAIATSTPPGPSTASGVQAHLDAIAKRPSSTNSYRALFEYYQQSGDTARAVAMASVLVAIRRADAAQTQFYEQHRPHSFLDPQRRPTQQEFDHGVRHPDQDPTLTSIFMLAAPAVGSLFARNPQEIPEMRNAWPTRDSLRHGHLMQAVEYAEAVLGVPSPRLYVNETQQGTTQLLALRDGLSSIPVVIAHQDLVQTVHEPTLAFAMVQSLAQLSAAHYAFLSTGRSLKGLRELFMACLACADLAPGSLSDVASRLTRRLQERVEPAHLAQLRTLVSHYVREQQGPVDLTQWIGASQLTLNRWALLMSGDLPSALSVLASAPERGYNPVSRKQMMQDLVLYSISEHYRELRQAIGLL